MFVRGTPSFYVTKSLSSLFWRQSNSTQSNSTVLLSQAGNIYIDIRSAAHGSDMQITTETDSGVLELRMQGRLDNEASDDFLAVMDDVLRKGHHAAMLDMRGVDYVSSAGLG